ncbi:MAG: Uma2 family endonuclease [Burkholderiales bacterium]
MSAILEVMEQPLSREALAQRFRDLCEDPRFANLPGKVELDAWGKIIVSPANNQHGLLQARLVELLRRSLGGSALVEASISTNPDLRVADVVWASDAFMQTHGRETPFSMAPEICIEVASPSNSARELREKLTAYLAVGAREAWIVYPMTKRIEFFDSAGPLPRTKFALELDRLFD